MHDNASLRGVHFDDYCMRVLDSPTDQLPAGCARSFSRVCRIWATSVTFTVIVGRLCTLTYGTESMRQLSRARHVRILGLGKALGKAKKIDQTPGQGVGERFNIES